MVKKILLARKRIIGDHLEDYRMALEHKEELLKILTKARQIDPQTSLYSDGETVTPWTGSGSAPYVQSNDANYIYTTTKNAETGNITFDNLPAGATGINSVIFKVETYCVDGNKSGVLRVHDGTAFLDFNLDYPKNAWVEQSIDVGPTSTTPHVTTVAEVNAMYVHIKAANSTNEQRVDYIWVDVDYNAGVTYTESIIDYMLGYDGDGTANILETVAIFLRELSDYSTFYDVVSAELAGVNTQTISDYVNTYDVISNLMSAYRGLTEYGKIYDIATTMWNPIQPIADYGKFYDATTFLWIPIQIINVYSRIYDIASASTTATTIEVINEFSKIYDFPSTIWNSINLIQDYALVYDFAERVASLLQELIDYGKVYDVVSASWTPIKPIADYTMSYDIMATVANLIKELNDYEVFYDIASSTVGAVGNVETINDFIVGYDGLATVAVILNELIDYSIFLSNISDVANINVQPIADYAINYDAVSNALTALTPILDYTVGYDFIQFQNIFVRTIKEFETFSEEITAIQKCCATVAQLLVDVSTLQNEVDALTYLVRGWSVARYLEENQ